MGERRLLVRLIKCAGENDLPHAGTEGLEVWKQDAAIARVEGARAEVDLVVGTDLPLRTDAVEAEVAQKHVGQTRKIDLFDRALSEVNIQIQILTRQIC